jgi:hypothetical protein
MASALKGHGFSFEGAWLQLRRGMATALKGHGFSRAITDANGEGASAPDENCFWDLLL